VVWTGSARTGGGHTFAEQSRKVLCPGGLSQSAVRNTYRVGGLSHSEAEKCARAGFRRVGFRAAGVLGRAKKNPVFFLFFRRPSRMYKEARPPFSEKKGLTFRPGGVMDVSAGRGTAQKRQPGDPGGREKPPPEERSLPVKNQTYGVIPIS